MTDQIHPDGLPTPRRYFAVLAIAIGIAMAVLDGTVVNVALPSIARELEASPSAAVWVINAYQLVIVVLLLPFAAMGERVGYRRIYQLGVIGFTLGSLACALSSSLELLIAARVVQGIGGAAIMSVNGALVRHTYPDSQLGRGVGLNGLVVSIRRRRRALARRRHPRRRPVAVALRGQRPLRPPQHLARPPLPAAAPRERDRPFDWTSAILTALMLGLFFIGADWLTRGGPHPPRRRRHRRRPSPPALPRPPRAGAAPTPLIPIDLFRDPVFALSTAGLDLRLLRLRDHLRGAALLLPERSRPRSGRDRPADDPLARRPRPRRPPRRAPLRPHSRRHPRRRRHGDARGRARPPHRPVAGTPTAGIVAVMALCGFGFGFFQAPNNRTMLAAAPAHPAPAPPEACSRPRGSSA